MSFLKKFGPLIVLLLIVSFLRFYNLGYSEFQDDEKKAFIRKDSNTTTYQFFMEQRKGPLQFIVTTATMLVNNDPRNELLVRFPFTIANTASIIVLYVIFKELFKSEATAFFGALLFSLNGFIVGFSRIAQYQNLNLLFSLLSLYFFIRLSSTDKKFYQYSLLGTLFFSLSLLSHWDGVFFLIPILYYYMQFLKNKKVERNKKVKLTIINFLVGCLLLLPFLVPYISHQMSNQSNIDYFNRRVGLSDYSWEKHKFIFELYNPFVALYFILLLAYFGIFNSRKSFILLMWFVVNFLLIRFFMEKPGTHIYNYVIPLIFLATAGIHFLQKHKDVYIATLVPLLIVFVFLYYQSYVIFVDNTREYPWDKNEIITLKNISFVTNQYKEKEVLTFGFPHFRNWKEVNNIVSNDPDNCTYISNEGKEITQIYMDSKFGLFSNRSCYYIADVTRPFITRENGAVFAKTRGKDPVYVYERNGEKLLKLYKIYTK